MYARNLIWRRLRRMRLRKQLLLLLVVLIVALCIFRVHRNYSTDGPRRTRHRYRENTYEFMPDPTTPFYFENSSPDSSNVRLCQKDIYIFGNLTAMKARPDLTHLYKYFARSQRKNHEIFFRCEELDCIMKVSLGTSISSFHGKDAVVFGMLPVVFNGNLDNLLKTNPADGQTWFYYSTDTPHQVVEWSGDLRIAELKYHKIMSYRTDSDVHLPFGYFRKFNKSEKLSRAKQNMLDDHTLVNKSKQLVWPDNECNRNFWPILPMVQRLQKQITVDDFGECGRYHCFPKLSSGCTNFFRKYYFRLEFTTSECYEYIPESFWRNFLEGGAIPIVYGAPKSDFDVFAPPNSFIHLSDFYKGADLVKYLKEISSSPEKYKSFFNWKQEGEAIRSSPHKMCTLCSVIPHLGNWDVKVLGNSSWYNGCRRPPNINHLKLFDVKQQRWEYILWGPWAPETGRTIEEEKELRKKLGKF